MSERLKKVSFHTLGCRLNMAETGPIAQGFVDRGFEVVEFGQEADVVFLNTCTVTDRADSTCRSLIRKARTSSPQGKVVVAGCYAQMEAEAIRDMDGVDLILGTSEKYKIFDYLEDGNHAIDEAGAFEQGAKVHIEKSSEFWGASTLPADDRTRAFLKIQDGCNYVCAFCIIPFARGRSRAITITDAVKEASGLIKRGYKEIVLTGVNIGEYENSTGEKLSKLIAELLALDGLHRLRLSSVEPNTITDELLHVLKSSPKFMDHFHVPLQSGDDQILKSMRRKYTVAEYSSIIRKIKEAFPDAGIGADVITGLPGEGEGEFANTFNLLRELPITHFHVFPYSKRQGTTASRLSQQVPFQVKKARTRALIDLGKAKLDLFSQEMQGRVLSVLLETERENSLDGGRVYEGYTGNYLKVKVDVGSGKQDLQNQIVPVRILGPQEDRSALNSDAFWGRIT